MKKILLCITSGLLVLSLSSCISTSMKTIAEKSATKIEEATELNEYELYLPFFFTEDGEQLVESIIRKYNLSNAEYSIDGDVATIKIIQVQSQMLLILLAQDTINLTEKYKEEGIVADVKIKDDGREVDIYFTENIDLKSATHVTGEVATNLLIEQTFKGVPVDDITLTVTSFIEGEQFTSVTMTKESLTN